MNEELHHTLIVVIACLFFIIRHLLTTMLEDDMHDRKIWWMRLLFTLAGIGLFGWVAYLLIW